MKKKRKTLHLPEDLLVEILSRVWVASLARLRSTSKGWNNLIKDVVLPKKSLCILLIDSRVCLMSVDLHGTYNDDVDNVVNLISEFSLKDPLFKKEVDIREVFHCDGLLLCVTKQNRLVVWNPCSGKTSWIKENSNDKKLQYHYALGKSSCCNNEYKILRVKQHGGRPQIDPFLVEYEVYEFTSSYNSWRSVGETRDWYIPETLYGTSVNGNYTYWTAVSQESFKDILLRFDFSTERFVVLSLPVLSLPYDDHDVPEYCYRALSVTTGDHHHHQEQQLWMIATEAYDVNVWVEETHEINSAIATSSSSWRNFKSMEPAHAMQCFTLSTVTSFLIDRDEKVLVCCSEEGILDLFDEEDKFIKMDHNYTRSRCSRHLITYVLPTNYSS